MKEILFVSKLACYPNPSNTGIFTIPQMEVGTEIKITNITGKVMFAPKLNGNILNFSNHPKGVYLVYFNSNGQAYKLIIE